MKNFKKTLLKKLSLVILGKVSLEKLLCYLGSNFFIRNNLRLQAIPIAYTYTLDIPEIRIAKIGNYQLNVNIAEISGVSLYFFGEHNEPFSAWVVSKLVNPGDICIDIGANIGSYSFLMAGSANSKGKIFAFEPNPVLHKLLVDSVKMNNASNFIFIDNRAVYKKSGEILKFYLSDNPRNTGTSSLVNHGVFVCEENWIQIETVTLTDHFRVNSIEKSKIVKIDVERGELEVLQGMLELLQEGRIDYILLEQLAGSKSQELLQSMAYEGWLIDEKRKILIDINSVELDFFGNYLFASKEVREEFKTSHSNLFYKN